MNEPGWLSFYDAASEVEERGVSRAVARKQLRQACADQLIASMKAPRDPDRLPFELWVRIPPHEWRERAVDYDGPDADGCATEVMIREEDFKSWLNGAAKTKGKSKLDLARQVIRDTWPNGIPQELSNKQIAKQVGECLKQQGRSDISSDTILRAAGRK